MVKPEWGIKRVCPGCGVRFYDLCRRPIVCPGCESGYGEEAFVRNRRSRSSEPVSAVARPKAAPVRAQAPEAEASTGPDADVAAEPEAEIESGEDRVLEDVSDLGEDDDGVAEVVEKPESGGAD